MAELSLAMWVISFTYCMYFRFLLGFRTSKGKNGTLIGSLDLVKRGMSSATQHAMLAETGNGAGVLMAMECLKNRFPGPLTLPFVGYSVNSKKRDSLGWIFSPTPCADGHMQIFFLQ